MQMMYELIAKEIKSMKLPNAHPLDYLNFYCLGNREQIPGSGQDSQDAAKVRMCSFLLCVCNDEMHKLNLLTEKL